MRRVYFGGVLVAALLLCGIAVFSGSWRSSGARLSEFAIVERNTEGRRQKSASLPPAPHVEPVKGSPSGHPVDAPSGWAMPEHLRFMEQEESRALRTAAEEAAYREGLARPVTVEASLAILREGGASYSEEQEKTRMYALSHLGRALQVAEGEVLLRILEGLEALVITDNLAGKSGELKKSLAGDKVEAFSLLWRHDRDRAERIRERLRGTRLGPLIEFATARESEQQNHVVSM